VCVRATASGWPSARVRAVTDLFGSASCECRAFDNITITRKFSGAGDRELGSGIVRCTRTGCDDRSGNVIVYDFFFFIGAGAGESSSENAGSFFGGSGALTSPFKRLTSSR
jgi:hypothetical protein